MLLPAPWPNIKPKACISPIRLNKTPVAALAEEYGVSFIDYNLMWEEIGLDSQLDYRDKGTHLNFGGAKKITKDFGAYLESAYNLTDHRGDSTYSFWDESAQRFNKDVKKLRKKENRKKK